MIEISNIKLTENEAFKLYQDHKYIVTYSRIFQVNYHEAKDFVASRKLKA